MNRPTAGLPGLLGGEGLVSSCALFMVEDGLRTVKEVE